MRTMAHLGRSSVVGDTASNDKRQTNNPPKVHSKEIVLAVGPRSMPSPHKKPKDPFHVFVTLALRASRLSVAQTEHIAQHKWRESTVKAWNFAAKHWFKYCENKETPATDLSFENVMAFMEHHALEKDCSYNRVAIYRHMLSLGRKLIGDPFSESEALYIRMFADAVFNNKPPIP